MVNKVWKGFIQIAPKFSLIEHTVSYKRYVLEDQFGNPRYYATIWSSGYCIITSPRAELVIPYNSRFASKFIKNLK